METFGDYLIKLLQEKPYLKVTIYTFDLIGICVKISDPQYYTTRIISKYELDNMIFPSYDRMLIKNVEEMVKELEEGVK